MDAATRESLTQQLRSLLVEMIVLDAYASILQTTAARSRSDALQEARSRIDGLQWKIEMKEVWKKLSAENRDDALEILKEQLSSLKSLVPST
jgi:hypothetical protein